MCTAHYTSSFMYIIILIGEIVPCETIVHDSNNNNNNNTDNEIQANKLLGTCDKKPIKKNIIINFGRFRIIVKKIRLFSQIGY